MNPDLVHVILLPLREPSLYNCKNIFICVFWLVHVAFPISSMELYCLWEGRTEHGVVCSLSMRTVSVFPNGWLLINKCVFCIENL